MGFIYRSDYYRIQDAVSELTAKVAIYAGKSTSEVRWFDYVAYTKEVLGYVYVYHDFGNVVGKRFYGSAQILDGETVLIINTHASQNSGRIHFTTLHEIAHAYYHLQTHPYDTYSTNGSDNDTSLIEQEADLMASFMLISDEAIFEVMKGGMTFKQMCNEFECSYASLYVRLKNFLYSSSFAESYVVLNLLNKYRYQNDNTMVKYINKLRVNAIDYERYA